VVTDARHGTTIARARAVASAGIEGRCSERVVLEIPIAVSCDGGPPVRAHTLVVNGHGALILSPCVFRPEALLRVVNQETGRAALCRLAWIGGEDLPGLFKLGIEILGVAADFWGTPYDGARPSRAPGGTAC
jgi:hypothetical protein